MRDSYLAGASGVLVVWAGAWAITGGGWVWGALLAAALMALIVCVCTL